MISFSKLGSYGRLGNQLFQYAFLRSTAERLGTRFYCPTWEGDTLFDLNDTHLRADQPEGIVRTFGPPHQAGFFQGGLAIEDGSEIEGFFQSEKFFHSRAAVKQWYSFKTELAARALRHLPQVQFENAVSLSLRLDDDYAATREFFPLYPLSFYRRALQMARPYGQVVVFADRPDRARRFLASLGRDLIFPENIPPHEQLYLMSRFRDNVITNSTFAWWGAWLNANADCQVFAPSHWCRPGLPNVIDDILPESWTKVRATTPVVDHFLTWKLLHPVSTVTRLWAKARARMA